MPNVRKSDIQAPTLVDLATLSLSRVIQQIRSVRFNFWAGRIELSETTTTIEPMEPRNERS